MARRIFNWFRRPPDFVIGAPDRPYLRRWWVIPRNRWFNIYLHQILRDDDDRALALHDHPWWNCSIPLRHGYWEHVPIGHPQGQLSERLLRRPFVPVCRRPTASHRIALRLSESGQSLPAWSLFITGPNVRAWGFWCPQGWRHWKDFVNVGNPGEVGRGCAD